MKFVIAGAGGQLGTVLVRELQDEGHDVVGLTRRDLDVTDPAAARTVTAFAPDVIINASAWNDVDGAETNPAAALSVNRDAVQRLADAASAAHALLIHYSTDFVFDGRGSEPYTEESVPAPLNRYGESKWAGEQAARGAHRFYVLRLASVFGGWSGERSSGRSTIDRMIDAVLEGRQVRAFVDRTVSPSYAADVARATSLMISLAPPCGVYHCVNDGFTTWNGLAREISAQLGGPARIIATESSTVNSPARRPQFCALSNAKLARAGIRLPTWQDALARHLARRTAIGSSPAATTALHDAAPTR